MKTGPVFLGKGLKFMWNTIVNRCFICAECKDT